MKASTKMQKGFTLIELMVVIVIIGILSAVALPKMFGLGAKAKAAEVSPAAAQYERLQGAYIAEASAIGTEDQIGWEDPQSRFFSFVGTESSVAGTMTISLEATFTDDCKKAAASVWTSVVATDGAAERTNATSGCSKLTTNFKAQY